MVSTTACTCVHSGIWQSDLPGWDSPCDQPVCGAHRWWLHAGMWLLQPLVATASWCTAIYAFCIRVGSTLCVMAWCLQCAGKYCIILS